MVGDWDIYQGNRLVNGVLQQFQEQRNHNAVHEIISIDRNGPLIPLAHDAKGNLTLDEDGNTYTWDFDNRLKEVRNANGDLLGAYTYDALGRRTTKTVPGNLPGDPQVTTAFVCLTDDSGMGQILAEYEDNTLKRMYTYGQYIDEPITMDRFDANLPGGVETLHYHRDRQYNLIGLTDTSGVVQERYAYSPYGERRILAPDGVTVRQTSAYGNPLGHQGLYHDGETGLVYNRARYRDAGLGRFLGRDPLDYEDGLNLFSFVGGMPYQFNDPQGLAKDCIRDASRFNFDLPSRLGKLKSLAKAVGIYDLKFKGHIEIKRCDECCEETNNETWRTDVSISGGWLLEGSFGSGEKKLGPVRIRYGWYGRVSSSGSISAGYSKCSGYYSGGCSSASGEAGLIGEASAWGVGGGIRGGINVSVNTCIQFSETSIDVYTNVCVSLRARAWVKAWRIERFWERSFTGCTGDFKIGSIGV